MSESPSLVFDFDRYPYLTADCPPVRGAIRREIADFQVEEVPGWAPSDEGEHLYIRVEKIDLTTRHVVEHLRDALGVSEDAIGWAGLKDRRAVATQWLSLPWACHERLADLPPLAGLRLLESQRHATKLQEGHLAGNRFRILIREPDGTAAGVEATLTALAERGVPNYFGPQRFGWEGKNAERGLALIRKGRGRSKRWLDRLLINSLQSLVFNAWLARRLTDATYDHVLHGDIAHKHATGGKFLVGDPATEDPRATSFEISATGPLFGKKYHEAAFEARLLEDEILTAHGLSRADFNGSPGSRRAIRFKIEDWSVESVAEGIWLAFTLPRGTYATSVLREVMQANPEPHRETTEATEPTASPADPQE